MTDNVNELYVKKEEFNILVSRVDKIESEVKTIMGDTTDDYVKISQFNTLSTRVDEIQKEIDSITKQYLKSKV